MKKIQIINGPNLNLLGKREPTVYGNASFEDYLSELRARFPQCEISYYQSNVEGEIINKIHEVGFEYDGIVSVGDRIVYVIEGLEGYQIELIIRL